VARWTVIRVAAEDGLLVQSVLVNAFAPVTMRIDTRPPAAGPEWEFAVQSRTERELRDVLGDAILASRTRLDPAMRKPERGPGGYDVRDELAPPDPARSAYHNPPRDP
jgi:hypothetical protein